MTARFSKGVTVEKIFVNVFGRNGLISSEKQSPDIVDRKFTIRIIASKEMVPRCRVVCYYVESSGKIVYDYLAFAVEGNTHKVR